LESVDTIVTDSAAPADLILALRARSLEVIVAPAPQNQ
jgi:DeoR/GlpR family transcriptional regulator of sugar metabolism